MHGLRDVSRQEAFAFDLRLPFILTNIDFQNERISIDEHFANPKTLKLIPTLLQAYANRLRLKNDVLRHSQLELKTTSFYEFAHRFVIKFGKVSKRKMIGNRDHLVIRFFPEPGPDDSSSSAFQLSQLVKFKPWIRHPYHVLIDKRSRTDVDIDQLKNMHEKLEPE